MTSHKNITYAVALAGALTFALAGCNGGENDPTATSSSSSSSSTTSPSPSSSGSPSGSASSTGSASPSASTSVSVPVAARANTADGAVAFAKWTTQAGDYAFVDLNPSVLSAVAAPGCVDCDAIVKSIADMKASGYHQKGRSITVDDAQAQGQNGASRTVQLLISKRTVAFVHSGGTEAPGTKAEKFKLNVKATWSQGAWQLNEVRREM